MHPLDLFFILLKIFIEYLHIVGTVLGTQHIVKTKTDRKQTKKTWSKGTCALVGGDGQQTI